MTREELIAAMQATAASKPRPVETKAWGTVYVREVTVAEMDEQAERDRVVEQEIARAIESGDVPPKREKQRIARSAARVICDADGKLMFDPDNAVDVALIAAQPWPLLSAILQDKEPGN